MRLDDLAGDPVWVAWRNERRRNNDGTESITKVPYSGVGRKARSDDPQTWQRRDSASEVSEKVVNGLGGGVGIFLGIVDCQPGWRLGGIDLDTCRDKDGYFTNWAADVIARFDSYTEISPSGTGAKVFFLYRTGDLPCIHEILASAKSGKKWARQSDDDHPPAIELYVSHRYFAVTGEAIDSKPTGFRRVDFADIEWLVKEAGPSFVDGDPNRKRRGATASGQHDQSRSAKAFRRGHRMHRAGRSFDDFREALKTDPETADWYTEKGAADGERELQRIWKKAAQLPPGPPWNINLKAPYDTARLLLQVEFSADGSPTLCRHRGGFYAWNGTAFPEIADAEIRAQIYGFLDQCVTRTDAKNGQAEDAPVRPNTRIVNDVADALRAAALLPDTVSAPAWLDNTTGPDPGELIACANGLLHLPTRDLRPHSAAFFTQNALDYAYDPAAPNPVSWLAFLNQLWPDDAESIATLRQIFGYCLTADTSQQKAFLIVGPKRSGKGTIARVLRRLVGAENVAAPTLASLPERFGLQPLIGKRLAIISDARLGGRADQAAITERLLSITGEDALTIDRKNRDAWTGKLDTRFLILTNELPRLADASGALASRFIMLLLTESFYGREDLELTNKLLSELPGILNWSIQGWRRLRRRGHFVQPVSAGDAISDLEALGSPVGAFVRERCEVGPAKRESAGKMFREWRDWCEEQGRDKAGTAQTFGRDLRAAVPGMRTRQRKDGDRFYEGIALRVMG